MRVFVTGATGFVGSAVTDELIANGHQVLGFTRSEAGAQKLLAAGAEPHYGTLEDLDSLKRGAEEVEAVIHCGFIHDFSKFKENCEIDRLAIEALGSVLKGSDRPLIATSGTGLIAPGAISTEDTKPSNPNIPRVSEQTVLALAPLGIKAMAMRLPPSVHGRGDHGFVPILIGMAREKGVSVYTGEGNNHWPAVHRLDAARAYRLAIEKGTAGSVYHATDELGIPFREIAEAIGKGLGLPVESRSPEDAAAHFGWFAHFAAIDNRASSEKTRAALGWQPKEIGLLEELAERYYFAA
jgi:nucleoside-diphosphate-sugar epimerase